MLQPEVVFTDARNDMATEVSVISPEHILVRALEREDTLLQTLAATVTRDQRLY